MNHHLTDIQAAIVESARQFTADEITPHAARWDIEHYFPRETLSKAGELGFGSIYVDEQSGGIGLSRFEAVLIFEALAYGCPSTSAFISIHNMATWMVAQFGSDELKNQFLPKLVTMEHFASYCLTEPDAGSDAASLRTRAQRQGDHYLVNGSKAFISGGGENEIYICMVRTGGEGSAGISCILVEKDTPGLSFGAQEHKLGWHSQPTAAVHFDNVKVPVGNLVGSEAQGFKIAMAGLDGGRLNISACSVGGAQRCIDETIAYTGERRQFGKAIAEFQNTQFMLADMSTQLEAARSLLYLAAEKVSEQSDDRTHFAAMAKLMATEACSKITDDALQLHGGNGYLMDYPIERFARDLRVHQILEGTSQIMKLVISREMLSNH